GAAVGGGAVPARGGAVPRGGAAGPPPDAAQHVPRQGAAAEHGAGAVLLRPGAGAGLADGQRRRAAAAFGAGGRALPGVRGDAAAVHGAVRDVTAAAGAGAAGAAVVGVAGSGAPGGAAIPSGHGIFAAHQPDPGDPLGSRGVPPLTAGQPGGGLAALAGGGAGGGVGGAGVPRLHPQRAAAALQPVGGGPDQQLPVRAVADERLPVRAALRRRGRDGFPRG